MSSAQSDRPFPAIRFQPDQPLDELSLLFMARADQGEAVVEILLVFLFLSQRLKIGKKARRPVVAGRVAAFDFLLDFTPDALAASLDLVKPNAASFFGFLGLPASFCFQTLGQAAFSCFRNLLRPLAQRSGRTARRRVRDVGRPTNRPAPSPVTRATVMVVPRRRATELRAARVERRA